MDKSRFPGRTPPMGELRAFAEFSEAQVRGENPSIEETLARYPEHAEHLRPLLETAVDYQKDVDEFKRKYPDFSIWDFFRDPRAGGSGKAEA